MRHILLGGGITMIMFLGQQLASCALEQTKLAICSSECWLVLDMDSIVPKPPYV